MAKNMSDPVPGVIRTGSMKTDHLGESVEPHPTTPPTGQQFGIRAVSSPDLHAPVWIAANRGDTEPSRIDRLEALAHDLADHGIAVRHLYDHKGRLSINVAMKVTAKIRRAIAKAWKRAGEYVVEAYFQNGVLVTGTEQSSLSWFIDEVDKADSAGPELQKENSDG